MRRVDLKTAGIAHICAIVAGLTAACVLTGLFCGRSVFAANPYNSYTLQALSWLDGRLDLGRDYAHLELAYFGGKVYVSFPPLPSLILLPFAAIFGANAPDHLIALVMANVAAVYAFKTARRLGLGANAAAFAALFATIGGNFLYLTLTGGWVWFFAQIAAFMFTILSFYNAAGASKSSPYFAAFFLACAVGCRPFNAVYAPLAVMLIVKFNPGYDVRNTLRTLKRLALCAIPAAALCLCYAALNYARFGDPLEFGHSYLPEFATEPQFGLRYVAPNLRQMLRLPVIEEGRLTFHRFNGMAFWLCSPIFLSAAVNLLTESIRRNKAALYAALPVVLIAAHILIFCAHRTLGGWHFGNRYPVDAIPAALVAICLLWKGDGESVRVTLNAPLLVIGLIINAAGSAIFYLS